MYARIGDRLIVPGQRQGERERDAEILDVRHPDGSPPYLVRWTDNGHEGLVYPGPSAYVQQVVHQTPTP
jgi:hypothetical protein